jgi:SPX domain protein involved in polyphosphate accumulation
MARDEISDTFLIYERRLDAYLCRLPNIGSSASLQISWSAAMNAEATVLRERKVLTVIEISNQHAITTTTTGDTEVYDAENNVEKA